MIQGNEGGYARPQIGSVLRFQVSELTQFRALEFEGKHENVPLPSPFTIQDVSWENGKWSSLRALSGSPNSASRVTMDLQKIGSSNWVRCWVLVEYRDRIIGVLYSEGTITPK